uniref:Chlororespiratory reduction 42 n=1 Tax=Habenaria pantlingiana TaxID=1498489 RepID=A0A0F7J2A9_9ASPA|nr:chlororespiratory reduction 42 [Habenaria pantlingiana]
MPSLVASTGQIAAGSARLPPRQTPGFFMIRCQSLPTPATEGSRDGLQIGSPVVLVEAPPTLKTAVPMPSLRVNNGQVKAGDVGRIVSRKPKDVWAVRLAIGTYLIDGKHFRPLDLDHKAQRLPNDT